MMAMLLIEENLISLGTLDPNGCNYTDEGGDLVMKMIEMSFCCYERKES